MGTKPLSEEKESQGRKNRQCLSCRHIISWEIKLEICSVPTVTSWQIDGERVETVTDFIFGAPKSLQMVTASMKLKDTYSLEGKL